MYTVLKPKRNDFAGVRFVKEKVLGTAEGKGNVLVLGRPKYRFVWREFKTRKHFEDDLIEPTPPPLQRLLATHIRYLKKHVPDQNFLLLNTKLQPLSKNGLTKLLQPIFYKRVGKRIGSSDLRRLFLSDKYDIDAIKEKEQTHKEMMHSGKVAERFYIKK